MPLDPNYRKTRKTHSRGTRAAQPLAADVLEGTLYFVTDEGIIEQSNGASWVSYSGAGGSGSQGPRGYSGLDGLDGENTEVILQSTNFNSLFVEFGSWTPVDASGAGLTFTSVTGTWKKIGPIVFVRWTLRYPVTADTSLTAIGGLPYTISGEIAFVPGVVSVTVPVYLYGPNGTTIFPLTQAGGASVTNNQASNQFLDGSGFYFV